MRIFITTTQLLAMLSILIMTLFFTNPCLAATSRKTENLLHEPVIEQKKSVEPSVSPPAPHRPPAPTVQPSSTPSAQQKAKPAAASSIRQSKKAITQCVQISPQGCRQNGQSVICALQLTSQQKPVEVMLFCYSGIGAVDANKKSLPCNEVRTGGQRSWEYTKAMVEPNHPQRAEIDLSATGPVQTLVSLHVTFSVDGQRQTAQWDAIVVQ